MTFLFFKYHFWRLIKSFRGTWGITTLILAGSIVWVGFLLVDNASRFHDNTSANLASGTSSVIIEKNAIINSLARQLARQQIERVFRVGTGLIDQKKFVLLASQGQWKQMSNIMMPLLQEASFTIDQIIVVDGAGMAHESNTDFSSTDWYQGVQRTKVPYLSETYYRALSPRRNVIAFAFPVLNGENVVAVIAVQMKTDLFLKWLATAKPANEGHTFIVDQRGHVVAHPDLDPQGKIQNYSNQPDVKKAVDNRGGTEIVLIGQDTYISSFLPLSPYGWGVITRIKIR